MRISLTLLAGLFCLSGAAYAQEPDSSFHNTKPFGLWLMELRQDAQSQGISPATLDAALSELSPQPDIIELDRKQPEGTQTLKQYLTRTVTPARIQRSREMLEENRALLDQVSQQYGVEPSYIVALWGVESSFGERMGQYGIVESLATLAYDGRRSEFFRGELLKALQIINSGDVSAADMVGSWAGAMGQCQFMPSSFLQFAVDYDRDGKRDIWNDQADVFASIANYLHSSGWNYNEGWGFAVRLPHGFNTALADIQKPRHLSEWQKMGVRAAGGGPLPERDTMGSLILVGEGDDAVPYIVFNNYRVILKWNRSRYFATAISMIASRIAQ